MSEAQRQLARTYFARNLRTALAFRGKSSFALAFAVGLAPATIRVFRQAKALPSSEILVAIARELDVTVEFLLGSDDVSGQIEDVFQNVPPRMTDRQIYLNHTENMGKK